jgi:hypothetical protein
VGSPLATRFRTQERKPTPLSTQPRPEAEWRLSRRREWKAAVRRAWFRPAYSAHGIRPNCAPQRRGRSRLLPLRTRKPRLTGNTRERAGERSERVREYGRIRERADLAPLQHGRQASFVVLRLLRARRCRGGATDGNCHFRKADPNVLSPCRAPHNSLLRYPYAEYRWLVLTGSGDRERRALPLCQRSPHALAIVCRCRLQRSRSSSDDRLFQAGQSG